MIKPVPKASQAAVIRSAPAAAAALALSLAALVLVSPRRVSAQDLSGDAVWADFIAWFKSVPPGPAPPSLGSYAAKLAREGLSKEEVGRRLGLIMRLFSERPEGPEVFYDRAYARPATGDPVEDGFASVPSAILTEAAKGLAPGTALDVGIGQGRNAVWLAGRGWDVTGFDISGVGLAAARDNAAKAGVTIRTVKAAYDDFDFGTARWDLVAMIFAWAPIAEPSFRDKVVRSLRPGGVLVFEHFVQDAGHPRAPMVRALSPGELRALFPDFEILLYEEKEGIGDWGGPGSWLVRMIARKPA
jgi:SAM-dependent methyltransferase